MVVSESFINILDIVILVCFVFLVFFGYQKGFLSKLFGLFGSVLFLYLSWKLSGLLAEDFAVLPHQYAPFYGSVLADFFYIYANRIFLFLGLFILFMILFVMIKICCSALFKLPILSSVNRLMGCVFALVEGFLLMALATFLFATPLFKNGQEVIDRTLLRYSEVLMEDVYLYFDEQFAQYQLISDWQSEPSADSSKLVDWLRSSGISDEKIRTFLIEITGGEKNGK